MADDNVQHGIDDNPHDDGKKGLELGALGGGATGAIAGAMLGPVGAIVGAIIGGTVGSLASGAAVDAVDKVDNDNTVSGVGTGATTDANTATGMNTGYNTTTDYSTTSGATMTNMNNTPGVQTGGMTTAGADTRGITEKVADAVTGDRMDDKTGGMTTGMTGGSVGADYGTAPYGTYQGRQITRDEYEKMPEQDRMRVQLIQEELHVDKATRQAGEVTVSKHVVEEQVQVPVTLQREEVVVTRHAVDRPVDAAMAGEVFTDQTIRVPVHEEVAQVTKTAHVAEEIEIEKRSVAEQRTISDTVRHEELDVNTPKNVRVDDSTTGKM